MVSNLSASMSPRVLGRFCFLSPPSRHSSLLVMNGLWATRKPALGHKALLPSGPALFSDTGKADRAKGQLMFESGEDEEEEEEEEEDFKPSDGSENEMETEILDYV